MITKVSIAPIYIFQNQSISIIEELFPPEPPISPSRQKVAKVDNTDSFLDKLILSMSQDLIDDFPASDPRWMESVPGSGTNQTNQPFVSGSTMSLLILHQLEDKQRALDFYINFLKEVGLWNRVRIFEIFKSLCCDFNSNFFQLHAVNVRDALTSTTLVLCEHVEKTATAISLRQVHSE